MIQLVCLMGKLSRDTRTSRVIAYTGAKFSSEIDELQNVRCNAKSKKCFGARHDGLPTDGPLEVPLVVVESTKFCTKTLSRVWDGVALGKPPSRAIVELLAKA